MLSRWQSTIVDLRGNVVPYAQLQILREQTQSTPTIYRDKAGTEAIPNAIVTANQNGYAYFYAPADLYRIRSSQPTIDWRDVDVGSAAAQQLAQQALDNAVPTYETLVDMQADTSQPVPTLGRVVNDSVLENNGYYVWTGAAWDRAAYQPLSDMDVSIDPAPGKIPLAGGSGTIKQAWVSDLDFELEALRVAINRLAYGDGPYPTLDLMFAGAQLLDPRVEFTRASTAAGTGPTGRIYTAAIDEPRFTYDPETGKSEGLLVEGQATNLLLWSEDITKPEWGKFQSFNWEYSISDKLSPIEGVRFCRFYVPSDVEGGTSLYHQAMPTIAGEPCCFSFFVSKDFDGLRYCQIDFQSGVRSVFDIEQGEFGILNEDITDAGAEDYGDSWRVWLTRIGDGSNFRVGVMPQSTGAIGYSKDFVAGQYQYTTGFMFHDGSHPTSYIPTTSSQATRIADTPIIPVGDWFNPDEGTFVVEGEANLRGSDLDGGIAPLLKCGEHPTQHYGIIIEKISTGYRVMSRSGGSPGTAHLGGAGGIVRIAVSYERNRGIRATLNGGEIATANNPWDGSAESLFVGMGGVGGTLAALRRANGPIARIAYYPRALSNAQLQELTA